MVTVRPGAESAVTADSLGRDLQEWLASGRLTLVDGRKELVTAERWAELPEHVRRNALADFDRVVRGTAKAAVIFLRD